MPFSLSKAPASFQGFVNKILAKILDVFVIVYPDETLIYTEDPGQGHLEANQQDEVRFLGYGLYMGGTDGRQKD